MKHFALCALIACSGGPASPTDGSPGDDDATRDGPQAPAGPRLIPGPGEAGFDQTLADTARAYDRQFHTFSAQPFGLSLDAWIPGEGERALVAGFLAQDATDEFAVFAGRTVPEIVEQYDEHGDLGMFAGAAAAGEAFRYIALRDGGHDATRARAELLAAIDSFHVAATITGVPGTVARGIRRLDEPGPPPATEPVPGSCPQPGDRGNRWRTDGSGMHPGWIYNDNNSKDQVIGYVFALGAFWDAIAGDPTIPDAVRAQVQRDARELAQSLMQVVPVGFQTADLVIRDWRNCPTKHLDLNPRIVPIDGADPIVLPASSSNQNGWNALAALGVIRTLYHVSGDAAVGAYYYGELVAVRAFPTLMVTGPARVRAMYQDSASIDTNFSNVNMAFVAAYGLLRYESDPALRATYEGLLANELWDVGHRHDARATQQAFFNLIYSAFRGAGNDPATTSAAVAQLHEFVQPPYFDAVVENCDASELAAGSCLAIDGTTTITLVEPGSNLSRDPLPKRLRPPSNFEWRSDPRSVNGGGHIRLDPGGDFRAAYWLGRALLAGAAGAANVSPVARPRVP